MLISRLLLTILRKSQLKLLFKHPNTKIGHNFKIGDYCSFSLYPDLEKFILGNDINFRNSCNLLVGNKAQLIIGNQFFMNNNCSINCLDKIEIGDSTLFGEGVKLYDHNHQYIENNQYSLKHKDFNTAPIKIGSNCWLGSHVIVLKGVTIGDNVIIGAGCIIHKDVPSNAVIINKQELTISRL